MHGPCATSFNTFAVTRRGKGRSNPTPRASGKAYRARAASARRCAGARLERCPNPCLRRRMRAIESSDVALQSKSRMRLRHETGFRSIRASGARRSTEAAPLDVHPIDIRNRFLGATLACLIRVSSAYAGNSSIRTSRSPSPGARPILHGVLQTPAAATCPTRRRVRATSRCRLKSVCEPPTPERPRLRLPRV
jgi:hypothetical protein